ncbi:MULTISPECIES: TIGR03747 family integrating conjugative element membrane protein [unclassified Pseudomonas]|uniref:TIGR03747 family integrating conjugative element membrane protein n=1 Tax=unclassified Pseudomonas TaxID=196821 RepID=UPI000C86D39D|nr:MULTISPECIES: TIGR03747 family integrating conjugative element membrane protein [unclassified Pseudomonas]PMV22639.1 TIGR03747 family integrating conjugative element membrane protein [Pseudomonas sp. FW305-3-2-15-C-TSA2]PMV29302.1 TIGR03747 family integrating conjugative element membrane protein [Pseudomonas sp. DP16D-L5]PMV39205.1 TIGR03747 family integrating conjugative element membrane protein [Pseudomonas sp. FW305-3-2-15-A-LB2]PMV45515.1 TIGR03747 family integrating conjugative element 
MNSPSATAQRQPTPPRSILWRLVMLPFHILGALLGSLILSIVVECVGMTLFWQQEGWRHAQAMLTFELDQLSENFTRSLLVSEPGKTGERWMMRGYQLILVDSGLAAQKRTAHEQTRRYSWDIQYYRGRLAALIENYLIASAYAVLVFGVRLMVLCLSLPFCLTALWVGVIDGLVRRDLRRFGAGRESGFVYHRAKTCLIPLTALPWAAYLASPVSINPLLVALPMTVLLAVMASITAANFKKHL